MRKGLLFLFALILTQSCKKESSVESSLAMDSVESQREVIHDIDSSLLKYPDSVIDQSEEVERVLEEGVMRKESQEQIVRSIDASERPLRFGDEFKNPDQSLLLKLTSLPKGPLKVELIPEDETMNLRINQIRYPDGTLDGPFGREMEFVNPKEGEIWLRIGKSLMASSSPVGKFSIVID